MPWWLDWREHFLRLNQYCSSFKVHRGVNWDISMYYFPAMPLDLRFESNPSCKNLIYWISVAQISKKKSTKFSYTKMQLQLDNKTVNLCFSLIEIPIQHPVIISIQTVPSGGNTCGNTPSLEAQVLFAFGARLPFRTGSCWLRGRLALVG